MARIVSSGAISNACIGLFMSSPNARRPRASVLSGWHGAACPRPDFLPLLVPPTTERNCSRMTSNWTDRAHQSPHETIVDVLPKMGKPPNIAANEAHRSVRVQLQVRLANHLTPLSRGRRRGSRHALWTVDQTPHYSLQVLKLIIGHVL